ncbi:unnamed protein product [Mytilus coruscus]|uniref:Uncharacterized protein n=1 Tax=Mytilus coruscus TaxID=42192 RepID=A0A6J8F1R9_MYTCO|nr:unnamed protein product [Mytilus coruscus]
MKSTKNRYFFDVELNVTQPINPCRGNATIHCHFGNQKVEVLNQYIDDCKGLNTRLNTSNRRNSTDDNSERTFSTDDTRDSKLAPEDTSDNQVSNEVTYIMVGIIVTLAVVTICMIIYSWRLKLKNKREEQKVRQDVIPHIKQTVAVEYETGSQFLCYLVPKAPISSGAEDITGIVWDLTNLRLKRKVVAALQIFEALSNLF